MSNYFLSLKVCVFYALLFCIRLNAQDVKVFILAGQSNMEGQGQMYPVNINGTLSHFMENNPSGQFSSIQNQDGSWALRDDVWVRYHHVSGELLKGNLGVGYGEWEEAIGPELGFGHLLGEYYQEQVLIVKTCWGGKNLAVDFRPPSSGGTVGPYYNQMIADVTAAINNISVEFPQYSGGQIEIAGFCWFQGWNDGESQAFLNEYEQNLKNLINDVRTDLNRPDLPFVVGLTGNGGHELVQNDDWVLGLQTVLVPAQISAAESPDFTNVAYADTRDFWMEADLSPEPDFVHHWYNNAESFLRIGDALGVKMIEILDGVGTSTDLLLTSERVSLYPVPVQDYFQLEGVHPSYSLRIWDASSRIVSAISRVSPSEKVIVAYLNPGVYFIEIIGEKGEQISIEKIIRN